MADQKITELTAATSIADADLLTIVQSGTNKKATMEVLRTSLGFFRERVTVSSAQLLTLGSVPVEIVAAPGANTYLAIHSIYVSYNYGTIAYVFAGTESPTFFVGSTNAFYQISTSSINGAADFNRKLFEFSSGVTGVPITTNTALTLGTADNGDPTAATGDGNLDVVVYYSIEDVNT